MDRIRPGWRQRAAKRKSRWNLLALPVAFALMGLIWYGLFQAAWRAHVYFYPEHALQLRQFWGNNVSLRAFVPSFLLVMPLGIPAVFGGLLGTNLTLWLIPPIRRVMDAEAAGDPEMTFAGANAGLIKWGSIASAVCITLSIIGIFTLKTLR